MEEFAASPEALSGVLWNAALDTAPVPSSAVGCVPEAAMDATGRAGSTGVSSELRNPPVVGWLAWPVGCSSGPGTAAGAVPTAITILTLCRVTYYLPPGQKDHFNPLMYGREAVLLARKWEVGN
ncbi:hypothetical protein [Streptomyces zaomyceticus]|uniref:hypothetical protein n=1 Tax=Streptomyces zaomyceticus TaxID=68286 RepID=UPI0037A36492